jgi:8-oxo-dGTP diphosphatase
MPSTDLDCTNMAELEKRQRVAAYGVARRADCILLVRAAKSSGVEGTWWLPGGGLEFGESPKECVVREFLEETGLNAKVGTLLDAVSSVHNSAEEDVRLHSVRLVYEVTIREGSFVHEAAGSTDRARWVPQGALRDIPLIPWVRDLLSQP